MKNPTVIAAIIGAVAVILAALIGLIAKTRRSDRQKASGSGARPGNSTQVTATGGAAAGRDIQSSPITITGPDRETTPREKSEGH